MPPLAMILSINTFPMLHWCLHNIFLFGRGGFFFSFFPSLMGGEECFLMITQCRTLNYIMLLSLSAMIHNTIADALSRLPAEALNENEEYDSLDMLVWDNWMKSTACNAVMHVSADKSFLDDICKGYLEDSFCKKLASAETSIKGIQTENGLWYVSDRLIIPWVRICHYDWCMTCRDISVQINLMPH
jgi:hypothetical protein